MSAIRSATEAVVAETRVCTGPCGRVLPLDLEHFNQDGLRRDGRGPRFKSRCRVCVLAANRAYHAKVREAGPPPVPERVAKLAAGPLGERVARAVQDRARVQGGDTADVWRWVDSQRGVSRGSTERAVFRWRNEARMVKVTVAYEVLDALDLQLVDAYPEQYLARKLPKVDL